MSGNVSVNIVNWNGIKYLENCLDSVYAQDYSGNIDVVIVDNASRDGSVDLILKKYPRVELISNKNNLGFCKAHNQAFRANNSEYCLPLNFDVILEKNFIEEMVKAAKRSKDVGMVSGKLYKMSGNSSTRLLDTTGIEMPYYFQKPRGDMEEDKGQYDKPGYVFGACGAAPLYRREMLEDIKINGEYFDEDFVNYVEDVDLAWRAQLRRWKCAYAPKAIAYHFRGCTRVDDCKIRKGYYRIGYRNRYWAMYKNITSQEFKKNSLKIFLKETVFLLTKKPGECSRIIPLQSLVDAIAGRRPIKKKRELIQQKVIVNHAYLDQFFKFSEVNIVEQIIVLAVAFVRREFVNPCLKIAYLFYNILKRIFRFCLKPFVPSFRKER